MRKEGKYKSIYPNLERWVNKHADGNWSEFARRCGINPQVIWRYRIGISDPSKASIDKILKATKLSYEEAFYEDI